MCLMFFHAQDWNRSRPYTDSMTNPNPGKHSWNNQRGSGLRGRPTRGPHPRGRGAGRGGRGGSRGHGGSESQKADQPLAHHNQSGPVQVSESPCNWIFRGLESIINIWFQLILLVRTCFFCPFYFLGYICFQWKWRHSIDMIILACEMFSYPILSTSLCL